VFVCVFCVCGGGGWGVLVCGVCVVGVCVGVVCVWCVCVCEIKSSFQQ
jgi:hypothetical protein